MKRHVTGHDFSRAAKSAGKILPCAAGSRAAKRSAQKNPCASPAALAISNKPTQDSRPGLNNPALSGYYSRFRKALPSPRPDATQLVAVLLCVPCGYRERAAGTNFVAYWVHHGFPTGDSHIRLSSPA